ASEVIVAGFQEPQAFDERRRLRETYRAVFGNLTTVQTKILEFAQARRRREVFRARVFEDVFAEVERLELELLVGIGELGHGGAVEPAAAQRQRGQPGRVRRWQQPPQAL